MSSYDRVLSTHVLEEAAKARSARLAKLDPGCARYGRQLTEILIGVGPWIVGSCAWSALIAGLASIEGASEWIVENISAPNATSTVGNFAAFLLASRIGFNLHRNERGVRHFSDLCGACIDLCVFTRASSSKIALGATGSLIELGDGEGGTFRTTRIGLVAASFPYIVERVYRDGKQHTESLPLAQDADLLNRFREMTEGANAIPPFVAATLLSGEIIDRYEEEDTVNALEHKVLFEQIRILTASEGAIAAMVSYDQPWITLILTYTLFTLYFFLLIGTDLAPNTGFHSLWLSAIVVFCVVSMFSATERFGNPFERREFSKAQRPRIPNMSKDTEIAIAAVFSRAREPTATFNFTIKP